MNQGSKCPCHSGKIYTACCQPFHKGKAAPTPLALMRSRYAAYALGKIGYVVKTWHPQSTLVGNDKSAWRKGLKQFAGRTQFVGLKIIDVGMSGAGDATVTFRALLLQDGNDASYTERSTFTRHQGRWYYLNSIDVPAN